MFISRLHYITQDLAAKTHWEQAAIACAGGADWVQLRVKNASEEQWKTIALKTQEVCVKHGAKLIINDNAALALEILADGVHLGKTDMSPRDARNLLGENFIIGGTANTFEDVQALAGAKVDYIGYGPYRFTSTKENLSPIVGLEGYKKLVQRMKSEGIDIPVIGIGGVKEIDVKLLLQAGLYGVAVSSEINLAEDGAQVTANFTALLK